MKLIKFFAIAACAAALAVSCNQTSGDVKVDAEPPTKAEVDSASYLMGVLIGNDLKYRFAVEDLKDINMSQVLKGMEDFVEAEGNPNEPGFGSQFRIDPMTELQSVMNGYMTKKQSYKAAKNLAKGKAFLAKNALKENVDTTASGLQYTIVAPGADQKVGPRDTVLVNYKGALIDGTVFDQNDSTTFVANQVIRGWTEGLGLLGEGGKATLFIPYDLAYGERGTRDGSIGPNEALVFDVEILKVNPFIPKEDKE